MKKLRSKELPIKFVDYGLGNRFDDHIEVNRRLIDYPYLLDDVLVHECEHSDAFWSWKDMSMDLKVRSPGLMWFVCTHPSAWCDFSPIWFRHGTLVIDMNILIFTSILLIGLILVRRFLF